jgi:protein gp37
MGEKTKIEWCDATINLWWGCSKVSLGCLHCYADTFAHRLGKDIWGNGKPREDHREGATKLALKLDKQAKRDGRRLRVFSASMSDWLDMEVPHGWRVDLLNLIEATPHLDWLLLTKRPESWSARMHEAAYAAPLAARWIGGEAPANVWVGTSAEDQQRWDERLPEIEAIPAVVRFVSAEPLLGHIAMRGHRPDWLVVGGESGPGARDMEAGWVKDLRDESQAVGTKFFFKQWGGVDKKSAGRELAGRTWDEMPDHATYAREFGTDVAKHISSVLGAERDQRGDSLAPCPGSEGGSVGAAEAMAGLLSNADLAEACRNAKAAEGDAAERAAGVFGREIVRRTMGRSQNVRISDERP